MHEERKNACGAEVLSTFSFSLGWSHSPKGLLPPLAKVYSTQPRAHMSLALLLQGGFAFISGAAFATNLMSHGARPSGPNLLDDPKSPATGTKPQGT